MSSDGNPLLLGITDIGIITDVLRYTGFQYQEPMCELDRKAARYALELYQNGTRKPDALIAAVSTWAECVSEGRDQTTAMGIGV
ncbi:hypothetical protein NBH19_11685 [Rhizobium sp. S95]|uniref:Uncharacterized protein n=1 Tax=Ciceribacter sichuanensis TaxID=2949647 RepID=A0AAJ1FJJ2_9HYPH|nr:MULTISPECIES: hypothetical protein [unclassified Ciceribacter]MCM2396732.1 hypothetical protein [Ciceribacter sp. S95]MCO5958176.1 hypothetical protein [Ciceribacter sp. S101]